MCPVSGEPCFNMFFPLFQLSLCVKRQVPLCTRLNDGQCGLKKGHPHT